jgi:DNA-binding HxlR family transcriptional regulator
MAAKPATSKSIQRSPCVISNVLEIIGDRWTLLLVRDLLFFNKHEYKEFLASPENIATNILADRLKKLLNEGLVGEIVHPDNKSRKLYYLTGKGKDLMPILIEMVRWGAAYLPERKEMKLIFERVKNNPELLNAQVFESLEQWEKQMLKVNDAT